MSTAANPPPPNTLPETWTLPPPEETVEPTWRVPYLLAPPVSLFALLLPKRLGPHLAASSWLAAWTAHLFGLVLLLGWSWDPNSGQLRELLDPLHLLRSALAGAARQLYQNLITRTDVGIAIAVFVGLEVGLLLASLLLWALYTVGESRRILAARAAKLLLWSTPGAAMLALLGPRLFNALPESHRWDLRSQFSVFLLLAWLVWYLSVILRLGSRYGGPRIGPRWEPFTPRCETCGYSLTGQATDGRCPECGREVAQSLPGYRQPPRYATASWIGRVAAFPVTVAAAMFVPDFGRQCSLWKARGMSEHFFYGVSILSGIAVAVLVGLSNAWHGRSLIEMLDGGIGNGASHPLGLFVFEPLIFGLLAGLGVFAIGSGERSMHMLFHRGHAAKQTVIINYMTSWLLVTVAVGGTSILLSAITAHVYRPWPWVELRLLGRIYPEVLIHLLGLAPGAVIGLLGILHAWRQLRMIRFANG